MGRMSLTYDNAHSVTPTTAPLLPPRWLRLPQAIEYSGIRQSSLLALARRVFT